MKTFLLASLFFMAACSGSKKTASAGGANDGSSYEKAIVVKNVSAEYAYVREVCPGCKFKRQELRNHDKKYYDVLFFNNGGSEAVYYFDINSFFGKGF